MQNSTLETRENQLHTHAVITWPPTYTVKEHPRALQVRLKISIRHHLEIVVPRRFNHKEIPNILETNRKWIEKHLVHSQQSLQLMQDHPLPTDIFLPALDEQWKIHYLKTTNHKMMIIQRTNNELVLLGNIENISLCKKILIDWVKKKAKLYLTTRLEQLSMQTQLNYSQIVIRDQNTRWGSCSSKKSISLNYKLIFFPREVVDYVIIHELCHTIQLNHSEEFWQLVSAFFPLWKTHYQELKNRDRWIPLWIYR